MKHATAAYITDLVCQLQKVNEDESIVGVGDSSVSFEYREWVGLTLDIAFYVTRDANLTCVNLERLDNKPY
jgi:hypothetical protein